MEARLLSVASEKSMLQRSTRIKRSPRNYNLLHYLQDNKVVSKEPVREKIGLKATFLSDKAAKQQSNCNRELL